MFRFDGRLGFPGGLLDPGETIETALNRFLKKKTQIKIYDETQMKCNVKRFREISEEMGLGNPSVSADDWLNSSFCSSQRFPSHSS